MSLTDGSTSNVPSAKRNMKVFGSFANAPPAALWFDKQFPPFVNFDQESACYFLFLLTYLYNNCFFAVPIYDARSHPFLFSDEDFAGLPSLPRFKKYGDRKLADLPPNALVTVFFTLNTYTSTRAPPTPSMVKKLARSDDQALVAGSSSYAQSDNTSKFGTSQVLSPNLQFLLYHGQIPDDD